jgi:hypothetical protein
MPSVKSPVQVVFDCADPARVGRFWAELLGYQEQAPPAGFADWLSYLKAQDVPEEDWNAAYAIIDPNGHGPRIYFQRVPEPKVVKNRVHLDVNVSGGRQVPLEKRIEQVAEAVERAVGLGATTVQRYDGRGEHHVVMRDPEGNEFCLQ